jgi:multidrug resistance efflux pump
MNKMARLDMERALALAEKGFASQERIEEFRTDQVEMETYARRKNRTV